MPGTTLTLSDTSAKFDLAALTEVTKAASGKTALLRILTGSDAEKKLSATRKVCMSDVKNASAVSVALSSDDKAITSLGSGKLTVSVPFKWDARSLSALIRWMRMASWFPFRSPARTTSQS